MGRKKTPSQPQLTGAKKVLADRNAKREAEIEKDERVQARLKALEEKETALEADYQTKKSALQQEYEEKRAALTEREVVVEDREAAVTEQEKLLDALKDTVRQETIEEVKRSEQEIRASEYEVLKASWAKEEAENKAKIQEDLAAAQTARMEAEIAKADKLREAEAEIEARKVSLNQDYQHKLKKLQEKTDECGRLQAELDLEKTDLDADKAYVKTLKEKYNNFSESKVLELESKILVLEADIKVKQERLSELSEKLAKYTTRTIASAGLSDQERIDELERSLEEATRQLDAYLNMPSQERIAELELHETELITLLSLKKPLTGYDNTSLIKQLSDALSQKVRAICSSPKQGVVTDELVQDVSLVKRINTNTVSHLASHTEHWKARTLSGLIPKRLKADIIEDDINIYENLFFKMAIDDISSYVSEQIRKVKDAQRQNQIAIDWTAYGSMVGDYRRGIILQQLFPERDMSKLSEENKIYAKSFNAWMKVSRVLLSIKGSAFYQSIDRKKHISKAIHLTNILKNDQRYKALYDIWCIVQRARQQQQEEQRGVTGTITDSLNVFYSNYICVSLLYAMKLLEMRFEESSTISMKDGKLRVHVTAQDLFAKYVIRSVEMSNGVNGLELQMIERAEYSGEVPVNISLDILNNKSLPEFLEINDHTIRFLHKPTQQERNDVVNLLRLPNSITSVMKKEEHREYQKNYADWVEWANEIMRDPEMHDPHSETITICPTIIQPVADNKSIKGITEALIDMGQGRTAYLLPIDLFSYQDVDKPELLRRLMNYGEAYYAEAPQKARNYNIAVLPITQTDIGSFQRLMKWITVQRVQLSLNWSGSRIGKKCPVCGGTHVSQKDATSWHCMECGIDWGTTSCTNEKCHKSFPWIRPSNAVRSKDLVFENTCDEILKKDSLFDRTVITDFEIVSHGNESSVTLYPVCPICGSRRH